MMETSNTREPEGPITTTNSERMLGESVFAGTRIPTFRVVELAREGGHTAAWISSEIYPELSVTQIRTVLRLNGISESPTMNEHHTQEE